MRTVYTVGAYKVVVLSAVYGVIDSDGRVLYKTPTIEDAIGTAEDIEGLEKAA